MLKKIISVSILLFFVLVLTGCGQKENPQGAKNLSGDKKSAPQEFLDVCSGKSEGSSCEFSMPSQDGKNSQKAAGTCKKDPSGNQLMCMGQGGPGGSGSPGVPPGEKPSNNN